MKGKNQQEWVEAGYLTVAEQGLGEVKVEAIDHRDACLSEEEKLAQQHMCLCVSRAKGNQLTLDL